MTPVSKRSSRLPTKERRRSFQRRSPTSSPREPQSSVADHDEGDTLQFRPPRVSCFEFPVSAPHSQFTPYPPERPAQQISEPNDSTPKCHPGPDAISSPFIVTDRELHTPTSGSGDAVIHLFSPEGNDLEIQLIIEPDDFTPDRRPEIPNSPPLGISLVQRQLEASESMVQSTPQSDEEAISARLESFTIPQVSHTIVQHYELVKERGEAADPSPAFSVRSTSPQEEGLFSQTLPPTKEPKSSHEEDVHDAETTAKPAEAGQTLSDIVPPTGQPFQVWTPLIEDFPNSAGESRPVEGTVMPGNNNPIIHEMAISAPHERSTSSTNADEEGTGKAKTYVSTKPTCSLNLVCYRSGAVGCKMVQVRVAKASQFKDDATFQKAVTENPELIVSDVEFFEKVRDAYRHQMCNFWRRVFFLKTLRGMRLLSYVSNNRPTVVELDSFVLQEILYACNHPSQIHTDTVWIDWVFRLRGPDKRHALEFVEGWNGTRIAIAGMTPLVLSTVVGLTWSIKSGDWQTAFTVAGFILTAGTCKSHSTHTLSVGFVF
ncbi:uncharacterized protein Z520_12081 [Fonsecaea multimorphosa CBS 102226]|uniref:Uncharacterized protein n=1 Tax=Fonsecaea multimorphosa CBS 102226 TaxID=1442371 RepID=A0A0D2GRR4_9EURO|nr:uncharacterized protein Z520_12081 [Fonsecaea multimorphosa CBS 102226]KIX92200.1 hypothetical protein Z520_12081 [Fonsecaea multimorphosa CBS 102226]